MNKIDLQVSLLFKDVVFCKTNYVYFKKKKNNIFNLVLDDLKIYDDMSLIKVESFEIRIFYKQQVYSEFQVVLLEELVLMSRSSINVDCISDIQTYNQSVVDIFYDWDNSNGLVWNNLKNKQKEAWLVACLYRNGIPKKIPQIDDIVIDGERVLSKVDFYCLAGESFFGIGGYLGQDLDGLNDCLIEIQKHNTSLPIIILKGLPKLEKALNTKGTNYVGEVIAMFESAGFVVKKTF